MNVSFFGTNGPQRGHKVLAIGTEEDYHNLNSDISSIKRNAKFAASLCMQIKPVRTIFMGFTLQNMDLHSPIASLDHKVVDYLKAMDGFILLSGSQDESDQLKELKELNPNAAIAVIRKLSEEQKRQQFGLGGNHSEPTTVQLPPLPKSSPSLVFHYETEDGICDAINWIDRTLSAKPLKGTTIEQDMKELDSLYDSKKLLTLFEQNSLPLHLWNNYGRLFVVWAALKEKGFEDCIDGEGWLCKHWRSYKESIGHGEKWHFTLTTFWVRIIHHASQESHSSFNALYQRHQEWKQGNLWTHYYSHEVMMSDKARSEWVPPNLNQLPS